MRNFKPDSSNVGHVQWDSGTMRVTFKSGATYNYHDVPEQVYHDITKAESAGGFFAKHIKDKFKAKKVDHPKKIK
jgi:KTSC domain